MPRRKPLRSRSRCANPSRWLTRAQRSTSPDGAVARRVMAALGRWQIKADDSAGESLSETPAGVFARLASDVALGGVPPVGLLALLKHPLFRLDAAAGAHDPTVAVL